MTNRSTFLHRRKARMSYRQLRKKVSGISVQALLMGAFLLMIALLSGLAGHSDQVSCEVTKGVICP